MGSTSPSRLNSRTNGPAECSSARTEGNRWKTTTESSKQRGARAAINLHFLKDWERCTGRHQSLMAHLLVFSRVAWNSASVREVAWLQHSSGRASVLSRLMFWREA